MNKSGLIILFSLFMFIDSPVWGQQFINGKLKYQPIAGGYFSNPYATELYIYKMGEDYKSYYALQSSTTLQNCRYYWPPSDRIDYLYNEIPGLDTLDVQGGNFTYQTTITRIFKVPPFSQVNGLPYPNYRADSICEISLGYNSDTMSRQGWSLELNSPLIKDSLYTLQFSIRSGTHNINPLSEKFHIQNLNPRAQYQIVVTQSNDRNEPGEELCRLDRFDIVGKDTFPFRYGNPLEDTDLDVYYKIRKNIIGKNFGKFITIRIYHNFKEDTFFLSINNNAKLLEPNCENYWINQIKLFTTCFLLESPVKILGDTVLCNSSTGNLLIASSNHSTDKYLWSTGETTSSIRVTTPGTYWLKKDRNGSLGYDTIEIKSAPPYQTKNIDTNFCSRNVVTIGDSVPEVSVYQWNTGQTTYFIQPTQSGRYLRTLSMGGCSFTDTFNIKVKPSHTAISASVFNICRDSSFKLKSLITPASWYFKGVLQSSNQEYDIIASDTQDIVLFTIKDCEQYDTIRIIPIYCGQASTIYIPNAFTPDGKGLNDSFYYVGKDWDLQSMKIYNRWGQKLFDAPMAWNGEYMQKEVPEGMYIYTMEFKHLQTNEVRFINGVLRLMR